MKKLIASMLLVLVITGCRDATSPEPGSTVPEHGNVGSTPESPSIESNPLRNAYFGDTHVHTAFSMDAYIFGTRRTPDDAYIFAKGGAIEHASGFIMQMKKPLDFLAVSDHAMYLGIMAELAKEDSPYADHPMAPLIRQATDADGVLAAMRALIKRANERSGMDPNQVDELDDRGVARSAWQEIIESAERHNDPGNFTAFIGYEYTSTGPDTQNLHRNVIFRGSQVPAQLFSRLDSENPEDLWAWMDANRKQGVESLAIPHNSNGSDGWMFPKTNWAGDAIDAAYAKTRMRNEPLVENTQVKGTSDTHPLLSPNDEWADFEIMPYVVASPRLSSAPGSYVRDAYLNGLVMQATAGFNPYKFGVIGSSDTHNAAGSFEEDNYWGKTGLMDIKPNRRGSVPLPDSSPQETGDPQYSDAQPGTWGASGLAGVWAESNTRDAIYAAFRRKETFSTSGPHIPVRFFGGQDIDEALAAAPNPIAQAYEKGVPMGADLVRDGERAPAFFVWTARDPDSVALQRLQIIKGWIESGEPKEAVTDIACSDGGKVDPATQRCPDNGATVDLNSCAVTPDKGAAELSAIWRDPDFDPERHAFYYVRVLENPKCRWSTWDAIRAGTLPNPAMHSTLQDRAWSSPIWYRPN